MRPRRGVCSSLLCDAVQGGRLADADRPPAILMTGPPGWLSGPCYDQDGPDVLAPFTGRWQVEVQPAQVQVWCAIRQRGTETRVVIAFSELELASKLTAIEAAEATPGTDPVRTSPGG